jgi:hypothetical protein
MKKIYLLIPVICFLSIQSVNAQFEKGKIMAGVTSTLGIGDFGTDLMSVGILSQKYKDDSGEGSDGQSGFGFNLLPRGGYFIMDNLAVGIDLLVGYYSEKDKDDGDKYSETTLAIGPFVRYYYPLENIYPFAEVGVGLGSYKEKGESWDDKEGLFVIGAGIGAAKPLGENVMIDAMLGYSSQSWKQEDGDKYIYGSIGLRVGFTLFFGSKE